MCLLPEKPLLPPKENSATTLLSSHSGKTRVPATCNWSQQCLEQSRESLTYTMCNKPCRSHASKARLAKTVKMWETVGAGRALPLGFPEAPALPAPGPPAHTQGTGSPAEAKDPTDSESRWVRVGREEDTLAE